MNIIILGNFGLPEGAPSLVPASPGELDAVLGALKPEAGLRDSGLRLRFAQLEDFRPESLAQQIPACATLLEQRRRLQDPATWKAAAQEMLGDSPAGVPPGATPPVGADDGLFSRLLGAQPEAVHRRSEFEQRISALVAPHLKEGPDARQAQLVGVVEAAIAESLRPVLHDPQLQRLESAWRGVDWLLSVISDEDVVQTWLAPVAIDIAAEAEAVAPDLGLLEQAIRRTVGGDDEEPKIVMVALLEFGNTARDLALLEQLGHMAQALGAPLFAGASPNLLGIATFAGFSGSAPGRPAEPAIAEAWERLRRADVARSIALAAPRVVLRQPYGRNSDPVDGFAFEELPPRPGHESFLWGSAALACARLIAEASGDGDDDLMASLGTEIEDLPVVTYNDGTGSAIMPVAETLLSQADGTAMLDAGVMPLLGYRNRNSARVMQFRSISRPSPTLRGLQA